MTGKNEIETLSPGYCVKRFSKCVHIDWNADDADYLNVYEMENGKVLRKGRIRIEWLDEENDE